MAASPRLDFLSTEFNIIDELDDNTGNYRTFDSLDGVVTADMRHHEERKRMKPLPHGNDGEPVKERAEECCTIESGCQDPAPPLTIVSHGRTLVISSDIERALDCGALLNEQGLNCALCIPTCRKSDVSSSRTGSLVIVETDTVSVSGSFGGFTAMAAANGNQTNLSTLFGDKGGFFDLVLDLQAAPSYTGKLPPVGYYAPGESISGIDQALAELPTMRGRFTKPQFTVLRKNRCLHGRSRIHDCRRCLETCPVSAIHTVDQKIVIDPYLCQGCGGCALVCPADAIEMQAPPQENLLSCLVGLLSATADFETPPSDLVLYDANINSTTLRNLADTTADNRIFFAVEEIARIGLEVLLTTLAYGAGRVTLICDPERPAAIKQALQQEAELGKTILRELHIATDHIRFIVNPTAWSDQENDALGDKAKPTRPVTTVITPAVFSFAHDKRTLTRLAAQHLYASSETRQPAVPLPANVSFGAVAIDAATCSLCMACVGCCPSKALAANGDLPRISLTESRCHQCGLCEHACPENAIRLVPRLLCDTEAADTPVVLREVEPFNCVECGEPFASQAMINRLQEKLRDHWMYSSDRQARRLKMCRTCRTRDALTAGDYGS